MPCPFFAVPAPSRRYTFAAQAVPEGNPMECGGLTPPFRSQCQQAGSVPHLTEPSPPPRYTSAAQEIPTPPNPETPVMMLDWNGYHKEIGSKLGELMKLSPDTVRG